MYVRVYDENALRVHECMGEVQLFKGVENDIHYKVMKKGMRTERASERVRFGQGNYSLSLAFYLLPPPPLSAVCLCIFYMHQVREIERARRVP